MAVNRKKILLPTEMARAGWAVLEGREDLEPVAFSPELSTETFHEMLATAAGVALWGRPFPAAAVAAAPHLEVVSRIGVGYDAVDVPALSARGIPLFIAGTANSVSVAEQALFFMFHLARNGTAQDRVVREGNFDAYRVLRLAESPQIEVHIMPSEAAPTGLGEPGVPPIAPAVANALFALTGTRRRRLPLVQT